ncbi:MAG: MBL fold metallo-hydrolase [Myxococcota bacterium]
MTLTDVGWGFTAVYALRDAATGATVLVDTQNPGREERVLRRLARAGIPEDSVTAIVVTHGHPDHAGGAGVLSERLDVPIVAGAADAPYLAAGRAPLHPTGGTGRLVGHFVRKEFPPTVADVLVDAPFDLSVYGVDAQLDVAGGHTPGSLTVTANGGRDVIVGDLIRSRLLRHHVPALHFFHDDPAAANAALAHAAAGATTIWPIHGGALPAEAVRSWLDTPAATAVAARE